jgi:hypothetical protein
VLAEGVMPAQELASLLSDTAGYDARITVLGHIQRGGGPSAADAILASRLGAFAVESLCDGEKGIMVGCVNGAMCTVPLEKTWAERKPPPRAAGTRGNAQYLRGSPMTDSVVPAVSCRIPQEKDSFVAAAEEVMHLVASGRTGRGISAWGSVSAWLSAVALLEKPERIAVVTGFFVPEKGDLVSEGAVASIGPGGAAEDGRASGGGDSGAGSRPPGEGCFPRDRCALRARAGSLLRRRRGAARAMCPCGAEVLAEGPGRSCFSNGLAAPRTDGTATCGERTFR